MSKLAGRAALITGASQGLGKQIATAFLREGASVMICARDSELLEQTRAELAKLGKVAARACDVSNFDDVDKLVDEALAAFPNLDIVVNSAGVYGPKGLVDDVNWDDWRRSIEVNVFGAFHLAKQLVPHMRKRGHGKFLQLSGEGAIRPTPTLSAFAAGKAAVVRFCETLAHEVANDKIDVNCILPGSDDDAALAVFLASKDSDGISGRLISAATDPWQSLSAKGLAQSDSYTLRRVVDNKES